MQGGCACGYASDENICFIILAFKRHGLVTGKLFIRHGLKRWEWCRCVCVF